MYREVSYFSKLTPSEKSSWSACNSYSANSTIVCDGLLHFIRYFPFHIQTKLCPSMKKNENSHITNNKNNLMWLLHQVSKSSTQIIFKLFSILICMWNTCNLHDIFNAHILFYFFTVWKHIVVNKMWQDIKDKTRYFDKTRFRLSKIF